MIPVFQYFVLWQCLAQRIGRASLNCHRHPNVPICKHSLMFAISELTFVCECACVKCHADHFPQGYTPMSLLFFFHFHHLTFYLFLCPFVYSCPSALSPSFFCFTHQLSLSHTFSLFSQALYVLQQCFLSFSHFFPLSSSPISSISLFHSLKQIYTMSKWLCNFTLCPEAVNHIHRDTDTPTVL